MFILKLTTEAVRTAQDNTTLVVYRHVVVDEMRENKRVFLMFLQLFLQLWVSFGTDASYGNAGL